MKPETVSSKTETTAMETAEANSKAEEDTPKYDAATQERIDRMSARLTRTRLEFQKSDFFRQIQREDQERRNAARGSTHHVHQHTCAGGAHVHHHKHVHHVQGPAVGQKGGIKMRATIRVNRKPPMKVCMLCFCD